MGRAAALTERPCHVGTDPACELALTEPGRERTRQAIYIDPAAEMVIARFASHPKGANANLDPTSLPAYHAMAKYLMRA